MWVNAHALVTNWKTLLPNDEKPLATNQVEKVLSAISFKRVNYRVADAHGKKEQVAFRGVSAKVLTDWAARGFCDPEKLTETLSRDTEDVTPILTLVPNEVEK